MLFALLSVGMGLTAANIVGMAMVAASIGMTVTEITTVQNAKESGAGLGIALRAVRVATAANTSSPKPGALLRAARIS